MESDIVSGQQSAWVLLKKLGEGDAGEVYLVESLLNKQAAILKRPGKSAFASDMIRQTSQITNEGKILKNLSAFLDLEPELGVCVPHLIDQSKPGTNFTDRLFIIVERAKGFDLNLLARAARMGPVSGLEVEAESPAEKRFLQVFSESSGPVSSRVILQILHMLLNLFDRIHSQTFDMDGLPVSGILWNDVKPEHLYWNPVTARLTIIDWGNSQFLERDGATKDRRFSTQEDFRQFVDAMGRFLEQYAPDLLAQLEWPNRAAANLVSPEALQGLRDRIDQALRIEQAALAETRRREMDLLQTGLSGALPSKSPFVELESLHKQVISYGELPDFEGGLSFALAFASRFAREELMEEVQEICQWAEGLPGANTHALHLTAQLAKMASRSADETLRRALGLAVHASLCADWGTVLWSLTVVLQGSREPDWWYDLVAAVQRQAMGDKASDVNPQLIARRTLLTLQAMLDKIQDQASQVGSTSLERLQTLVRRMREEIIPAWVQLDPSPPYASLAYADVDEVSEEIGAFLPEARYALDKALELPRWQVKQVLHDWNLGDFPATSVGLRAMLLADPDRKRVLHAEKAVKEAPLWLARAQTGPQNGEHYRQFVTDLEFDGRDLRNQVGPAAWLDLILEGCRMLRKGAWPPDLFTSLPQLINEMPWLARFERSERLPNHVQSASNGSGRENSPPTVVGVTKGKLGAEQDLQLIATLDAWIPEARGSSARVFSGLVKDSRQEPMQTAVKLMRMDKVDYALPLFKEEVIVLHAMADVPGVTPLLECGFIKIEGDGRIPTERESIVDPLLAGDLIRIGPRSGQEFVYQIENRIADGWVPYLALEMRDSKENLLNLCDAGMTRGTYRPVADLLLVAIQICDILAEAHRRNIVYRDHKILHYYWLEDIHGVFSIDWNVARLHPEGLTDYEKQMDLVQFGARGLHHILTGRTAPGALPLGPTRPDEIEQAAKTYQAQWTYDDQRLPEHVRAILEKALAGEYTSVTDLREDLKQSFLQLEE